MLKSNHGGGNTVNTANEMLDVKVGDTVAILVRERRNTAGVIYTPNRLGTVQKITPKQIHLGNDVRFSRDGLGVNAYTKGDKITNDTSIIAELQSVYDKRRQERIDRERQEAERDARKTYQLASEICASWNKDPIADLELLGEKYLQRIVDDLAQAKAEVGQ